MIPNYETFLNVGAAARAAQRDAVLNDNAASSFAVCDALADAWMQGEHALVRQTIWQAGTVSQRADWSNGTRKLLPSELMKDAFDRYMKG